MQFDSFEDIVLIAHLDKPGLGFLWHKSNVRKKDMMPGQYKKEHIGSFVGSYTVILDTILYTECFDNKLYY